MNQNSSDSNNLDGACDLTSPEASIQNKDDIQDSSFNSLPHLELIATLLKGLSKEDWKKIQQLIQGKENE